MSLRNLNKLFFRIKSYISFIIKSKNKHGVHSPFVFDLITKCFNKKNPTNFDQLFLKYKKELFKNTSTINVTSNSTISNMRQVSKISKSTEISNKSAKLLIKLMQYYKPTSVIEIETSLGLSTAALSISLPNSSITTLEECTEKGNIAQNLFNKYQFKNIKLIIGNFNETLAKQLNKNTFDFVFFNGNHTKKATLDYFKLSLSSIHNNSFFLFNNIYRNFEMKQAWEEIKKNPSVTITIDTYQWGLVFFRKEQQKEHFTIRI